MSRRVSDTTSSSAGSRAPRSTSGRHPPSSRTSATAWRSPATRLPSSSLDERRPRRVYPSRAPTAPAPRGSGTTARPPRRTDLAGAGARTHLARPSCRPNVQLLTPRAHELELLTRRLGQLDSSSRARLRARVALRASRQRRLQAIALGVGSRSVTVRRHEPPAASRRTAASLRANRPARSGSGSSRSSRVANARRSVNSFPTASGNSSSSTISAGCRRPRPRRAGRPGRAPGAPAVTPSRSLDRAPR